MGQQQLLLIVLGVIIVGISIAVGVTQFKSSSVDANRQAVISDLVNLGAKAQRFYRTPTTLAGGGQNFNGFELYNTDMTNANGAYRVHTAAPTASDASAAVGAAAISTSQATQIYIAGWGTETGTDANDPVKVYARVTADSILTTVVN